MAIYRGPGGPGDAIADSANTAQVAEEFATQAGVSAAAAAASADDAANSATAAQTAQTAAEVAQTASELAETNAETAETNAETAQTAAEAAQTAAEAAQTAAETAETNAETAYTNTLAIFGDATDVANAVAAAQAAQTAAELAETNAETAQTAAEAAQTAAELAETNAETAETNAETAETNAAASASAAATSESNAATSASNAATSESNAATSASNAATSESNAATSASNAATSESNAATSASNAATSETNASNSASAASTSASNASTSASNAATSESNASASASAAATSETNAAASYDAFDDRYLGDKASDPALDNDGNALLTGALYFNTTAGQMKVYDGSVWVDTFAGQTTFVRQTDVGTAPNQVPLNQYLGDIAYQDKSGVVILGGSITGITDLAIEDGGTGESTQQDALNALAGGVTSGQYLRGNGTNVLLTNIQAGDVPTLNQNTTGQAGSVANAVTFNNSGTGSASGETFDGSAAKTISYNTIGAYADTNPAGYTTNTGTVTSISGTGTVNGISLSGSVTTSGNITLGGTLSNVSLTSQVTGTLPVANGGTGITSFGSGVATFLGTPSSSNLAAAVTGETGSGALVFGTSPSIASAALSGTVTDTTTNLVSQTDVGTEPNQVSLNQYLGDMAFQSKEQVVIKPAASAVPNGIGELVFQLTSNTSLEVKVKGSDGTVRSATLTLS
jgi:hypothetical protein